MTPASSNDLTASDSNAASVHSPPRQCCPVAETPRLLLRRIDRDDLDFFAALFADPEVMRFSLGVRTREQSGEWIDRATATYCQRGYGPWGVVRKLDQTLIGFCGLLDQTVDGVAEVEVAYRLAEPYWGQGFAPEAAAAARDLAFGEFRLARVIALIDANNIRSVRVAEKIGMDWQTQTLKWGRRLRVYQCTRRAPE
ncbi:MAG: GNAT family N-acetyltransferase [Planctomycetota bacterium]|nr:MAG: GNAT family N-acetyltransferase [Planctomycetota bacterium]